MSTHPPVPRRDSASRVIEARPTDVYRAFEDAGSLMRWLPPRGMTGNALEYDFREGGHYRIELRYDDDAGSGKSTSRTDISKGRFLELSPGRAITQSVEFESDDPAFAGTMTMSWTFESTAGGTSVTITADNVPSGIRPEDHQAGLNSSLENLAAFVVRR